MISIYLGNYLITIWDDSHNTSSSSPNIYNTSQLRACRKNLFDKQRTNHMLFHASGTSTLLGHIFLGEKRKGTSIQERRRTVFYFWSELLIPYIECYSKNLKGDDRWVEINVGK